MYVVSPGRDGVEVGVVGEVELAGELPVPALELALHEPAARVPLGRLLLQTVSLLNFLIFVSHLGPGAYMIAVTMILSGDLLSIPSADHLIKVLDDIF